MSSPIRRGASSPPSSPRSEGARSPVEEDRFDRFHDDDNDIIRAADDDDDEEDGEDLGENIMDDYKAAPELDVYEDEGVDNEVVEEIDHEARLRAERVMRKRDMQAARRDYEMQDSEDEEDDEVEGRRRRRRIDIGDENAVEDRGSDDKEELDKLTGFPLQEILVLQGPQRIIKQHYREFLQHPNNQQAINRMCVDNKQSLLVSYKDLARRKPLLAMWIADSPKKMLELFDEELLEVVIKNTTNFPQYRNVHKTLHVRVTDMPVTDSIRDLRQQLLNQFTRIAGVVVRRTSVLPQMSIIHWTCGHCNESTGPFVQTGSVLNKPNKCENEQCNKKNAFFRPNSERTVYQNYQRITLQESPGSVPAGRVPRQKDVILTNDLVDSCSPGEEVEITGIFKHSFDKNLNKANGFPVFQTLLEANYVLKRDDDVKSFHMTEDDTAEILNLSKKPNIATLLINSIAPSVYGMKDCKTAVALSLFGGVAKEFQNKHRIRGDINVLMLGDPGTAKSQILKAVEKIAQRVVYTTGKGASAVGLTASVRPDPVTREWTLEGGALVLADRGHCLIDEFDKMSDQDRTSIHEAMEQQSISVSKAGIITTLKARCAVIAAANPLSGRYVSSLTFQDQVDLTDAILSRFDALCVVKDTVERKKDRIMAEFVVDSHKRAQPAGTANPRSVAAMSLNNQREDPASLEEKQQLPQSILRKYIMYAKQHCVPKLTNIDDAKFVKLYTELRKEAASSGGIQIAPRHIESMIRMAEAHAKMHLRDNVTTEDEDVAMRVMLESFISTQKISVQTAMKNRFRKYMAESKDKFELLLSALLKMATEARKQLETVERLRSYEASRRVVAIHEEDFLPTANDLGISNVNPFYESPLFENEGFVYNRQDKTITHTP